MCQVHGSVLRELGSLTKMQRLEIDTWSGPDFQLQSLQALLEHKQRWPLRALKVVNDRRTEGKRLDSRGIRVVAKLTTLTHLHLGIAVTSGDCFNLAALPLLTSLRIGVCDLDVLPAIAKHLPKLLHLRLSLHLGANPTFTDVAGPLTPLSLLRELQIRGEAVYAPSEAELSSLLVTMPHLEQLEMSDVADDEPGSNALRRVASLRGVRICSRHERQNFTVCRQYAGI